MAADSEISRKIADRQVQMFTMFVGPGLLMTRAALVRASGIPEGTLREWANGAAMPFHGVMTLSKFLPGEAINMLTEPAGKRLVDAETTDTNWDALACSAAALVGEVCEARRDGNINHVEDARLKERTRALIAEAQGAVEAG
jgi:hypothetical protein